MKWHELEQTAYGPLALTPDQFWNLTWHEFYKLCEGYAYRQDRDRYIEAWKLSVLMQPYAEKGTTLTPETFLGADTAKQAERDRLQREWDQLQERNRRREEGLPPLQ